MTYLEEARGNSAMLGRVYQLHLCAWNQPAEATMYVGGRVFLPSACCETVCVGSHKALTPHGELIAGEGFL